MKTYDVDADDMDEAINEASERFNCDPETGDSYEQHIVQVKQHEEGERP